MEGDSAADADANQQTLPREPVVAGAEPSSSTEPSPYGGDVPEFYHLQMHSRRLTTFLIRRDAAASYTHVVERIQLDGVVTWNGGVPASGEAIAALPETTAGEGGECAVCLEAYEAGDTLRTMPCAHGFHERCIFEWLRVSRLCPLCRFALQAEAGTG
ncbi:hypothetical protein PVAP13_3NG009700 [Panicum virgatum]|uniref:RING-type domain-containing protein n=1 Tax=Panicum virgatum TaxID=38727 RepID=A0A8T0U1R7_PANVG|nr:hypothetical protein PVAP13_3NG009700 [Panicum virgatum]